MARDVLEERLDKMFENVNEWLKFAEAKNAALLTLDAAAIFGMYELHAVYKPVPDWVFCWLLGATALFFVSLLISLASFFARTKIPIFLISRSSDRSSQNLVFYGHLADLQGREVLDQLRASIEFESDPDKHHKDLAEQIVINSKIARKKYALFNASLWTMMAAIITPLGAFIFYWTLCDETI